MSAAMWTLRVTYASAAEVARDLAQQFAFGGLLVRVAPPAALQRGEATDLEVVLPGGASVRCEGVVLHLMPGDAVAVTVAPDAVARLRTLAAALPPDGPGALPARHELVPAGGAPEAPAAGARADAEPSQAEKIQMALHGSRDDRAAILRDRNRVLHPYVLRNPHIALDEVLAIAKNPQMSGEVLKLVGERKEWLTRSDIATALARNPKTPADLGVRALDFAGAEAVRQMAKGVGAPPHVVQAARKKVLT